MFTAPASLTLLHHELRFGTVAHVPRHLTHATGKSVALAIEASNECCRTQPVDGTQFELHTDLGRVEEDFNACYFIIAAEALGGGKVQAGTTLYRGVVACELATAPTAYRYLLRDYIQAAASARPHLAFSAFGPMPHEMPWTCGFYSAETADLTIQERDLVLTLARLAAVQIAALGERARIAAAKAGRVFALDTSEYPELL